MIHALRDARKLLGHPVGVRSFSDALEAPPLDRTQTIALIDYMTGIRPVTSNPETGEDFGPPHSPELRAFIVARLGDLAPTGGWYAMNHDKPRAFALAAFLRHAAGAIERHCA